MCDDIGNELNILISEASINDAPLIAELTRASWADKVNPKSSGHRETAELVQADLQRGGAFILFVNDTASGSVRWLPVEGESGVWEVRRMGVMPMYRNRNLSQYLLEAVIHRTLSADVHELRLGVRADQPRLVDFYAAFGFELAPELEYPHDMHGEPAPIMMRRIFNH
ncbi:MAG: family N-acetyltransferase [Burkholderiaceae bacterium]|nr:family N-acetyltransferase [Burkholderiaceae bacterium]